MDRDFNPKDGNSAAQSLAKNHFHAYVAGDVRIELTSKALETSILTIRRIPFVNNFTINYIIRMWCTE